MINMNYIIRVIDSIFYLKPYENIFIEYSPQYMNYTYKYINTKYNVNYNGMIDYRVDDNTLIEVLLKVVRQCRETIRVKKELEDRDTLRRFMENLEEDSFKRNFIKNMDSEKLEDFFVKNSDRWFFNEHMMVVEYNNLGGKV